MAITRYGTHLSDLFRMVLIVLWMTALHTGFAQERTVRFQHLTLEDGLPQNMVDCILQDRQGFMWFGTWNGLCRYDGYRFESFNSETDGINNFIQALQEDAFGNIWLGTREGVFRYRYDRQVFEKITIEAGSDENASIHSIIKGTGNTLLIGSGKAIWEVEVLNEPGEFRVVQTCRVGEILEGKAINALLLTSDGTRWIGTDQGVSVLSADKQLLAHLTHEDGIANSLSSNLITCFWQENNGQMWIGTEYGLNLYDPVSRRFSRFYRNETSGASLNLPHNYISDLRQGQDGNLIIGTLGGLAVYSRSSNTVLHFTDEQSFHHGLNNNFVNCLYVDRNENLWIGTERGGVNLYNNNQSTFEHYELGTNGDDGLSHGTVNSVYEDDRSIWIGTAGGGLNRYDKSTGKFEAFLSDPQDVKSISSDFVTSVFRDSKGQLWIGTWGGGMNRYIQEGNKQPYFQRFGGAVLPGEKSIYISSITEDTAGNLWVGTLEGLLHFDADRQAFSQQYHLAPQRITEVGSVLMEGDTLWAGTRLGLFRIDQPSAPKAVIRRYTRDAANPNSISGNYVISIAIDRKGELWCGTYGNGINRLDRRTETFTSYSTKNGFSNNIIYCILPDDGGHLWLSTDFGLIRFDPGSGRVRNFFTADGLLNNQYYWSACFKNRAGKLYFGGMAGMDAFMPAWINEEPYSSEVVLTDIALINGRVLPGKDYNGVRVLEKHVAKSSEIHLSYKEKMLSLEFSPLIYRDADLLQYAYILEGFEDEWNYVSADRQFATYTNLRPGDYTFKVKVWDANADSGSTAKEVAIIIAPPFWDTLWFQVLAILTLAGGVIGGIRYRMYTLKQQKMILEQQVRERTEKINHQKEALAQQAVQLQHNNQELQENQRLIEGQNKQLESQNWEILAQRDELVDLNNRLQIESQSRLTFFTNISHEFRTPLTLINGPIGQLLKDKQLPEDARRTLEIVNKNARRMLQLINQMLNIRKIEKIRMRLKVAPGDINAFCREIFEAFKGLADLKNIDFRMQEHQLPQEVWFDAEKLSHILYNLFSNAFKYTPEGGNIRLDLAHVLPGQAQQGHLYNITSADEQISIRVVDTGIGISEENIPLIFDRFFRIESQHPLPIGGSGIGLSLTKELILAHHGDIFVESRLGRGTVFEIRFPATRSAYLEEEILEKPVAAFGLQKQVDILQDELFGKQEAEEVFEDLPLAHQPDRPTILIVEDNPDLRKFIASQLHKCYNVLEAEDGRKGITLSKTGNPDLIISDLMMPHVDGYELCANIKSHLDTCHIPVILLTAKSTIDAQIEGFEVGADDYLPKPFHFDILLARINNLIESRKKLRLAYLGVPTPDAEVLTTNQKDGQFLDSAIRLVQANLDNVTFTVLEFAQEMRVSRSLLHKKLVALTDQSASDFINHLRMQKAAELLKQNQLNISEVAYAVGYSDPKYFSRLFSKHFGNSPKSYSQQYRSPVSRTE